MTSCSRDESAFSSATPDAWLRWAVSDLHEVLIERGLHPGHFRLEVRDLLLLRVQGARGKPKGPADLGVGLREILELLCESRDFDVDGFGAEGHVQASTGRGNMPLAGALAVEP